MIVFIVTDTEAGWNCVCVVVKTKKEAIEYCASCDEVSPEEWDENGDTRFVIHEKMVL